MADNCPNYLVIVDTNDGHGSEVIEDVGKQKKRPLIEVFREKIIAAGHKSPFSLKA